LYPAYSVACQNGISGVLKRLGCIIHSYCKSNGFEFPFDGLTGLESTRITMNNKTPIATLLVLHQADYSALQTCVEAALHKLGLQQLDGLSIHDCKGHGFAS
jgi:hypothetical protein